jgi:hypothetical protein
METFDFDRARHEARVTEALAAITDDAARADLLDTNECTINVWGEVLEAVTSRTRTTPTEIRGHQCFPNITWLRAVPDPDRVRVYLDLQGYTSAWADWKDRPGGAWSNFETMRWRCGLYPTAVEQGTLGMLKRPCAHRERCSAASEVHDALVRMGVLEICSVGAHAARYYRPVAHATTPDTDLVTVKRLGVPVGTWANVRRVAMVVAHVKRTSKFFVHKWLPLVPKILAKSDADVAQVCAAMLSLAAFRVDRDSGLPFRCWTDALEIRK